MVEHVEIEPERWKPSRRFKVWIAVSFAFFLGGYFGILARQLVTGPKPDWTFVGPEFAVALFFAVWSAVSAAKTDNKARD
jgi:hypothetical protein